MKRALITGITGQDGSYLAELLLSKGYQVHGMLRRTSNPTTGRISHILNKITLHVCDLTDAAGMCELVRRVQPHEFYNLAAQSFVHTSFSNPQHTTVVTGMGVTNCLEALRLNALGRFTKFYQASSSEMFGRVLETPQKETTPFYPRSPYGCAKAYGHYLTVNYREAYDMFACCGILFNHESPRRGTEFVTRKITNSLAHIIYSTLTQIEMGNLDAKRDWGHAKDYVEAMWLMLQQDEPEDFVIATGKTHSIKKLLEVAFGYFGLEYDNYVSINPDFIRPAEVELLVGDASKAQQKLNWKPTYSFEELIYEMIENDIDLVRGNEGRP